MSLVLRNRNIATIYPYIFRGKIKLDYRRETISTPDNDFIDIDWSAGDKPSSKLAVILTGLEGNSQNNQVMHSAKLLHDTEYEAVVMNYRGCSGRPNNLLKSYHSGQSEDLDTVLNYIFQNYNYSEIFLLGFSIGGNVILKYLGEKASRVDPRIKKAMCFSAPVDLQACTEALCVKEARPYMMHFLRELHKKIKIKIKQFPGQIDNKDFHTYRTFFDYDSRYTAPFSGFKDVYDYYTRASSKPVLKDIRVPSLIVNAQNDLFLKGDCFPYETAKASKYLYLETPDYGGHVGFASYQKEGKNSLYWLERRILDWLQIETL